jgi:hypothetical protein
MNRDRASPTTTRPQRQSLFLEAGRTNLPNARPVPCDNRPNILIRYAFILTGKYVDVVSRAVVLVALEVAENPDFGEVLGQRT